jgi:replicative DNA helicase
MKLNDLYKLEKLAKTETEKVQTYLELLPKSLRIKMYAQYCTDKQILDLLIAWENEYKQTGKSKYKKLHNGLLKEANKKFDISKESIL